MEAAPSATRIGVLVNPDNPGLLSYPAALKDARSVAGKTLIRINSHGRADIDAALTKAAAERISTLFVADDTYIAADPEVRRRVLAFAADARIPGPPPLPRKLCARRCAYRDGSVDPGRSRLCRQDPGLATPEN